MLSHGDVFATMTRLTLSQRVNDSNIFGSLSAVTKQPFAISPKDYPPALNVMGDKISVLAEIAATGAYAITLNHGREGNGPPPHSHDWDESFFVVKGNVEFNFGGETLVAVPGTLVHFPAGTVHSFKFCAGGAELLEITGKGSRAIEMFTALDHEIPPGSNDIAKTQEVLERTGVKVVE